MIGGVGKEVVTMMIVTEITDIMIEMKEMKEIDMKEEIEIEMKEIEEIEMIGIEEIEIEEIKDHQNEEMKKKMKEMLLQEEVVEIEKIRKYKKKKKFQMMYKKIMSLKNHQMINLQLQMNQVQERNKY